MQRVIKLALMLFPSEWRTMIGTLRALRVASFRSIAYVAILEVLRMATESVGLFMILPILQFVESGKNTTDLAANSRMWTVIIDVFAVAGMPVNLLSLITVTFLMVLLRQSAAYAAAMAASELKESVASGLRSQTFHHVLSSRATFLREVGVGHFVTIVNQHCQRASSVLQNMLTLYGIYLSFVFYGFMMVALAPLATIITVCFGLIMARVLQPFTNKAKAISQEIVQGHQDFAQFLLERGNSWRLLKLSNTLPVENEKARVQSEGLASRYVGNARTAALMQLIATPMAALFALFGLFFSLEVLAIQLAEVTLFAVVVLRLIPVFESFLRIRQSLASVAPSLTRVKEIIDQAISEQETDRGTIESLPLSDKIVFENVSYRYNGATRDALSNANVEIPACCITAITGPSGAGKSTLVDLLPRLIEPTEGGVYFDSVPATNFTLRSLRRNIAYVPQEPILFDGTVAENVAYVQPGATREEVQDACKLACADSFVALMPKGYDTFIGESGSRLSGGQRQRLVLARAFLSPASILILDEPTSALDHESEHGIRQALMNLVAQRGMTVIIIAHRASTIEDANYLIVLKDGRILEAGLTQTLRQKSGWYGSMLAMSTRHDE